MLGNVVKNNRFVLRGTQRIATFFTDKGWSMPQGRILPFPSSQRRAHATPEEHLKAVVGQLTNNIQILVLDGVPSAYVLKGLAHVIELAAIPARRRMAKADAEHAAHTPTANGRP
jgi:hypothetical protein